MSLSAEESVGEGSLDNENVSGVKCKPKDKNHVTVLFGFSLDDLYDYDEVNIWNADSPSEFIPSKIKKNNNGIEVMKGIMVGSNRRDVHVEFKNIAKFIYDIYIPKNEWDCFSIKK